MDPFITISASFVIFIWTIYTFISTKIPIPIEAPSNFSITVPIDFKRIQSKFTAKSLKNGFLPTKNQSQIISQNHPSKNYIITNSNIYIVLPREFTFHLADFDCFRCRLLIFALKRIFNEFYQGNRIVGHTNELLDLTQYQVLQGIGVVYSYLYLNDNSSIKEPKESKTELNAECQKYYKLKMKIVDYNHSNYNVVFKIEKLSEDMKDENTTEKNIRVDSEKVNGALSSLNRIGVSMIRKDMQAFHELLRKHLHVKISHIFRQEGAEVNVGEYLPVPEVLLAEVFGDYWASKNLVEDLRDECIDTAPPVVLTYSNQNDLSMGKAIVDVLGKGIDHTKGFTSKVLDSLKKKKTPVYKLDYEDVQWNP